MVLPGCITINQNKIDVSATTICTYLKESKYEAYIVGGCVRDLILERTPKDWDICTNAKPEEIITVFTDKGLEVIPTGIKHGTVTVMIGSVGYEVTTYRIDGDYSDGRHPDSVKFTSNIIEDLSRRDFTMNAMAIGFSPRGELTIIDPFNGSIDIQRKLIRCVGNPHLRFSEDALRMMRAIRFMCQLNFDAEEETFKAICINSLLIRLVSKERIHDELVKIMSSSYSYKGIQDLEKTELLSYIIPELQACNKCEQSKPWHIYNVFKHTTEALKVAEKRGSNLITKLAILYHDVGKPFAKSIGEDSICHFYGHPLKSAELAKESMTRLRFDNDTIEKVTALVFHHDDELIPRKPVVRRLIRNLADPDLFPILIDLRIADVLAQNPAMVGDRIRKANECLSIYHEVMKEEVALKITDLAIDGNDLIILGFKGKEIGDILHTLLELVTDELVENEKDKLILIVKMSIPSEKKEVT